MKHIPSVADKKYSIGFSSTALGTTEVNGEKKMTIAKASGISAQGKALGLKEGDVLLKVNGTPIKGDENQMTQVIFENFQNLKEREQLSFTVNRKDDHGDYQTKELSAPVKMIDSEKKHVLSFDENATPEQLATRKAWLTPQE